LGQADWASSPDPTDAALIQAPTATGRWQAAETGRAGLSHNRPKSPGNERPRLPLVGRLFRRQSAPPSRCTRVTLVLSRRYSACLPVHQLNRLPGRLESDTFSLDSTRLIRDTPPPDQTIVPDILDAEVLATPGPHGTAGRGGTVIAIILLVIMLTLSLSISRRNNRRANQGSPAVHSNSTKLIESAVCI
jgi:hypothetical protein